LTKLIPFLFCLLFLNSFVIAQDEKSDAVEEREIEVVLGIDRIEKIDFVPDARVMIGNDKLIKLTLIPAKKEIIFKGKKAGKTSVTLRNPMGDPKIRFMVTVSSDDKSKIVADLNEFLGDIEGLEIGIKGGTVYVGGFIIVPKDIARVLTVLEKYPDVMRLVDLAPQTKLIVAQRMQEEVQRAGLKDVTVRIVNGVFWLEGVTDRPKGDELAMEIAKAYLPDRLEQQGGGYQQVQRDDIKSFIVVNTKDKPQPAPKQLKVVVQFVELSKSYIKKYGFSWMPFLTGGEGELGGSISFQNSNSEGLTTSSSGTFSGVISNLFPRLESAKNAGYARIVQSGMVITKNQEQAKISKTESNTTQIGGTENATQFTSTIGFDLQVKPTILQEEKVDLSIGLKVSVKSSSSDNSQTDNNVSTSLIVKNKESAAVGGVVINKSTTDYDKDPPGGSASSEDAVPLFSLIRSKSFATEKSQYVVFITPEIIDSASEGTEEIRRKFRRRER